GGVGARAGALAGGGDALEGGVGHLGGAAVLAGRLAQLLRGARLVEDVVDDLEREAELEPELAQRVDDAPLRVRGARAALAGGGEQRRRLPRVHALEPRGVGALPRGS